MKTDGEPAIIDLWNNVRANWWGEVVKMESMVGDHNSNGAAEQAVQKVEDEIRTWKSSIDDAIKGTIPPTHDLMTWLVEHVCSVNRRTAVGADGKTPTERIRGRKGRNVMAELAECILYMPLRGDTDAKRVAKIEFEPRFMKGVFLGLTDRSDEILVAGPEGIRKARTIRRLPEEERWNVEQILAVQGTPLHPNPGSSDPRVRTTSIDPGLAKNVV